MNKAYFKDFIEQLGKFLIKSKNMYSQDMSKKLKEKGNNFKICCSNGDIDVLIEFLRKWFKMNRERVITWIDDLITQAGMSDKYFKERNELYIENQLIKEENEELKGKIDKVLNLIEKDYYSLNTTDIDTIVVSGNKLIQIRNILKESDIKWVGKIEQTYHEKKDVNKMLRKIYICDLCKKVLDDEMPIRFIKQEYAIGKYKQYYPIDKFDLCIDCYAIVEKLIASIKKDKWFVYCANCFFLTKIV